MSSYKVILRGKKNIQLNVLPTTQCSRNCVSLKWQVENAKWKHAAYVLDTGSKPFFHVSQTDRSELLLQETRALDLRPHTVLITSFLRPIKALLSDTLDCVALRRSSVPCETSECQRWDSSQIKHSGTSIAIQSAFQNDHPISNFANYQRLPKGVTRQKYLLVQR